MAQSAGHTSWRDFANSYMLGRCMCNGNTDMSSLANDLLTKEKSPWVRFVWKAEG